MNNFSRRGFTLVEMLVVVAIVSLLAAMTIPAVNTVLNGTNINRAGELVGDQIRIARQEAVTKNREVDVRFYHLVNGSTTGWTGLQVWRVEQTATGASYVAVGKVITLPAGIIISDPDSTSLSPLLNADASMTGTSTVTSFGNVAYRGFSFRADGSPESVVSDSDNFLTLQGVKAAGSPPANYYTIQINSVTGKVIVYRP